MRAVCNDRRQCESNHPMYYDSGRWLIVTDVRPTRKYIILAMKCIIMPLPMNERLHNALDAVALSVICLSLPPSFSLSLTRDRVTSRATNV